MDIALMRLQYEILNTPVSVLADASGISEDLISEEIERAGWNQLWPNEPSLSNPESLQATLSKPKSKIQAFTFTDSLDAAESTKNLIPLPSTAPPDLEEDEFTSSTAFIIERARRRLQVYTLAKETYLASRYLDLESALLNAAIAKINDMSSAHEGSYSPQDFKHMSAMYKDLLNGTSLSSAASSLQIGTDESGIPTLIFKDLSGRS
jgi:hypothetical protein